jgi:superfamily II DNA or RNA helicase
LSGEPDGMLAQARPAPARTAARLVLERLYGEGTTPGFAGPLPLAAFQADAAARLLALLGARGGALLADSVGLGKTHVALAVIGDVVRAGAGPALVVTPAAVRRQWTGPLRRLARDHGIGFALAGEPGADTSAALLWTSHARLSRGDVPALRPGLVVVDEAHAFRNPATRRYRELARLCGGARVLLLTATPVNNALSDLYAILRLFLGDGDLADLGVADLRAFLGPGRAMSGTGEPALRNALAALTVRRTRRILETHGLESGLRFPVREPPIAVRYDPDENGGLATWLERIEGLRMDVYDAARPAGPGGAGHLVRISLLKRLESSQAALSASLERLHAFLRDCVESIPMGLLPCAPVAAGADPEQILLGRIVHTPLPRHVDPPALAESARADLAAIAGLRTRLRAAGPDRKLGALLNLLRGPLAGRSALVFTEFADTALRLHEALRGHVRTGLVTGRSARLGACPASRRRVIESFAPVSSGAPAGTARRLDVLIATDVLSEGLNLQDCGDVISYDLPWNPIRLLQRIGRIDRLGSPHSHIRCYNFMPDRGLDAFLGLLGRIREKLRAVRAAGGFDAPALPEAEVVPADLGIFVARLRRADPSLVPDLEREAEGGFALEERARAIGRDRAGPDPSGYSVCPPSPSTRPMEYGPAPILAAIPRPAGSRPEWLAVFEQRVARFLFVCGPDVREDRPAALRILADTAERGSAGEPGLGTFDAREAEGAAVAARRCLEVRTGARTRGPDGAGRAARHLLRQLAHAPGGPTPEMCRRADAVLDRLRPGLPSGAEAELLSMLDGEGEPGCRCEDLLDRLEALLERAARQKPGAGAPGLGPPRLIGLFRLQPETHLTLELSPRR